MEALKLAAEALADSTGSCPYDEDEWEHPDGCLHHCGVDNHTPADCYSVYFLEKCQATKGCRVLETPPGEMP
jgi:hypothetical protein